MNVNWDSNNDHCTTAFVHLPLHRQLRSSSYHYIYVLSRGCLSHQWPQTPSLILLCHLTINKKTRWIMILFPFHLFCSFCWFLFSWSEIMMMLNMIRRTSLFDNDFRRFSSRWQIVFRWNFTQFIKVFSS